MRGLLFRPWLLAGGICFGLAIGTKWTAIYPLAAFGVMVVAVERRRPAFVRRAAGRCCARSSLDGVPAFVHLVVVGAVVYLRTWTGWLMHADEYEEHLLTQHAVHAVRRAASGGRRASEPDAHGLGEVVQSLRSL